MKKIIVDSTKPDPSAEFTAVSWVTLILALTMLMLPAMGVPSEELLQDTFKSILLSFGILSSLFVYFWYCRINRAEILIHYSIFLPILLCIYALGSMLWSHTFLAGVEGIRWFLLSSMLFVASNSLNLKTLPRLAWGVHLGLTIASFWAALQFWFGLSIFPQGPNPASTFVNRNFFAEYCICAIPFSLYLFAREKKSILIYLLTATTAFNIIAIFMTGTRSALIALVLSIILLALLSPRFFKYTSIPSLQVATRRICICIFFGLIVIFGLIPTSNSNLIQEVGVQTPLDRAFTRTVSIAKPIEYSSGSFSVRAVMWHATLKMIGAHPLAGVGAGSWEVQAPLFQSSDTQLETDFYAHNEFLQLIAEYGIIGWIFVAGLGYFFFNSVKLTWNLPIESKNYSEELLIRIFSIFGLIILLLVSNAGFPFRLAGTCALFVLYISMIAASDKRINMGKLLQLDKVRMGRITSTAFLFLTAVCIVIASYITALAVQCERSIIRAVKIALTITMSKQPNNPHWDPAKQDILALINQGIAINPHYRKLTPMVADEMASWGDWGDAIGIWDSVLQSRPNVIALSANIAKGYIQLGDFGLAEQYLDKAAAIQPIAPAVRTVEALLFFEEGNFKSSIPLLHQLLSDGHYDYQIVYVSYLAGTQGHDLPLAIQALELRIKHWPAEANDAWLKLGNIYSNTEMKNVEKAKFCYQMAVESNPSAKDATLAKIPEAFRSEASSSSSSKNQF